MVNKLLFISIYYCNNNIPFYHHVNVTILIVILHFNGIRSKNKNMYGTAMAVLTNNIFLSVPISKLFEPRAI